MKVDPFIAPIPRKLREDPETRGFFEYFVRWAHDIWIRTGGSVDTIEATGVRETYPWIQDVPASLDVNIPNLPQEETKFRPVVITNNYTAVDNDWIWVKNGSTVTFPKYPGDGEEFIVYVGSSSAVSLNPNGKKINGSTTGKLRKKGTSIRFKYFLTEDEWLAI